VPTSGRGLGRIFGWSRVGKLEAVEAKWEQAGISSQEYYPSNAKSRRSDPQGMGHRRANTYTVAMSFPYPPDDLMIRIGVSPEHFTTREAREGFFADIGRTIHQCIREAVPYNEDQAILDFGCGSGRVLRWFASEPELRLVGCDLHLRSITWMQENFPSSIRLYANEQAPPLPEADNTFDLIYCGSVFSHLTDWAPWLLELRRILKPGGVLVASIHGKGFWNNGLHGIRGILWDEDHTGMLVERYGDSFDDSWGPAVYVSEWWVREHWGRALDIERFEPTGFGLPGDSTTGQAWLVARKPETAPALTPADLEAPSPDVRETHAALRGRQLAYEEIEHVTRHLLAEISGLRNECGNLNSQLGESQKEKQALDEKVVDLTRRVATVENSKSWNLTRPLRLIAQRVRGA